MGGAVNWAGGAVQNVARPVFQAAAPVVQAPAHVFSDTANAISAASTPGTNIHPTGNIFQQVGTELGTKLQAPRQALGVVQRDVVQPFITRPIAEVGATLSGNTFHPDTHLGNAVFGPTPVKPIQAAARGVQQTLQQNNNPVVRALSGPAAVADVGLHVAQDLPVVGGIARGGAKAIKGTAPAITKGLSEALPKVQPLNQEGKFQLPFGQSQNQSFHYTAPTNGYTKVSGKANAVRLKLNEQGGINNPPINGDELTPEAYSRVFGVSPRQAKTDLNRLKNEPGAFDVPDMPKRPKVSAKIEKQLTQPQSEQFRRPTAENTSLNPLKVDLPEVRPGDYGQARLHAQAASKPVEFAASQAVKSVKKLNPVEKATFWKAVEDPRLATTPKIQEAVNRWKRLSDQVHATSQALGGNTNYVQRYARHNWDLSNPDDAARFEALVRERGGQAVDPYDFAGVNAQNRAFSSIREGEAAGFKLKNPGNPEQDIIDYANSASGSLKKQALAKAVHEADINAEGKTLSMNLPNGQQIENLSPRAMKEIRAFKLHEPSTNKVVRGLRTANVGAKTTILSGGQFHPINISVLRAGPSTALAGHPIAAAKGVARTFRPLLPGGKGAVDRVMQKALDDGIVEKAAKIGAPYGQAGYNVEGSALKSGVGHKMVFERQMPMMHDQVVRSVIKDLEKKGISLDSQAAREAGTAANATMGFINKEALNISPEVRQAMSDLMLAGQFTPSKVVTLSKVAKGGVAGKYARSDVASNAIAATALITGVGYALGQKSDSIRDSLLRALINPAVPTPMKDRKGNNVEERIPLTYTGEISKILGLKLKRGADGHLGVDWKPSEALSAHSGLMDWMRSRLSPLPGIGVKLATNTNFSDKPLFDSNAPGETKAAQAATTIGQGLLPIGLQGIPNTDFVKKHAPGTVRDILEANTPGSNPALKGLASSAGFSPRTDQTVGKGGETARFFNAADEATRGLQTDGKAAVQGYIGSKKNPVTGKYDMAPTVWDTISKSADLLKADESAKRQGKKSPIDALINMNKQISKDGGKVDPLWNQSKDRIRAYLQYQSNADPFSPQRSVWYDKNKSWYEPLSKERGKFFGSLPKGDPNKPQAPVEFPAPSQEVQAVKDQYYKIDDSQKAYQFTKDHPELQDQFDKEFKYKNDLLKARGYAEYKGYPKATPGLQSYMDKYNASDKATRKAIRNSDPATYQKMIAYYDSVDLYKINSEGAKNQLVGQPDQTSKQNKAISSVAKDIYQNADGTYQIVPAGWMGGLSNDSSGGSGYSKSRRYYNSSGGGGSAGSNNLYKYAVSLSAGGAPKKGKVTAKAPKGRRVAAKRSGGKPRVSLKASRV